MSKASMSRNVTMRRNMSLAHSVGSTGAASAPGLQSVASARQIGNINQLATDEKGKNSKVLRELGSWSTLRMMCYDLVDSKYFGGGILCVILLNTVLIALQTDRALGVNAGWYFSMIDSVFLGIYILELAVKYYVWRGAFFKSGWNVFDFVIVLMSLLEVVWLVVLGSFAGFNPKIFRLLRLFRAIRAFRALRVLRTITFFQNLQIIVITLLKSIPAWGSISLLLVLVLYIFAIIGVTTYGEVYPERFGSLWLASFSLFQLITLDDWFQFYEDVRERDGGQTMIYFLILFIVLETFIFVNLFVAVIVNNLEHLQRRNAAINKARREQEHSKRERMLRRRQSVDMSSDKADADKEEDAGLERLYASKEHTPEQRQKLAHSLQLLAALDSNLHSWGSYKGTLDDLVDVLQ